MTLQVITNPEPGDGEVKVGVDRTTYLSTLLSQRQPLAYPHAALQALRDRAALIAHELMIPTTRDESWRFTNLAPLVETAFQPVCQPPALSATAIEPFCLPEATIRLVMVDGVLVPELCVGLVVGDRLTAADLTSIADSQGILSYLAQQSGAEEVFTVLNTASFTTAALVWVAKHQEIPGCIHLLHVSTGTAAQGSAYPTEVAVPTASYPRCLVVLESGGAATIVEEYASLTSQPYFTNAVTELYVGDGARLHHTRVQQESDRAIHIGKTAVSQGRSATYIGNAINLGGRLSRHNLDVMLMGEQTETTLNGLTTIRDTQLADTHSAIVYSKPYGTSRQIHKCIVSDRAHAVFNGKVVVPKAAQLTDAAQLSRTLLLSPKARVDAKPQLEITADNVKCTHGATVSQLDTEEIFYLQSRGLSQESAQHLLVTAFAEEVLRQIPVPSLATRLRSGDPLQH
jgi:Fe-S cluster assembly protein SufD